MKNIANFNWKCPSCALPLHEHNRQWKCANQHSFDIAKENYANLLLAQHKSSKQPGDSKEMVFARRAFLQQDHYLPLAEEIATLLQKHHNICESGNTSFSLFDAGCGEGYYLPQIIRQLPNEHVQACGLDISKPAIQKAAKRNKTNEQINYQFAVASSFNIPLASNSQHAAIQIFAPSSASEINRVLINNGLWINVNPASHHLYELKEMVYREPELHATLHESHTGFKIISQEQIKFTFTLNTATEREQLLMMTPFFWTISEQKKSHLLDNLHTINAHFDIQVLQKIIG